MPVGKVQTMTLHPMSFDEFLDAMGDGGIISEIRDCYERAEAFYLHDAMLERFWQYVIVGGMPEAVARFAKDGDYAAARDVQSTIIDLYVADMAKYATPTETARIRDTWNSIPCAACQGESQVPVQTGEKRRTCFDVFLIDRMAAGSRSRGTMCASNQRAAATGHA
jgi:hypothetical protein